MCFHFEWVYWELGKEGHFYLIGLGVTKISCSCLKGPLILTLLTKCFNKTNCLHIVKVYFLGLKCHVTQQQHFNILPCYIDIFEPKEVLEGKCGMRCCLGAAAGHSVAPVSYRIVSGLVQCTSQYSSTKHSAGQCCLYSSADQDKVQLQDKVQ